MKPRSSADYRLLVWTLLFTPLLPTAALLVPSLAIALLPVALYFAYCIGIASHYHNHRTVFSNRLANQLYSMWLSIFYGVPLFAWIPTHNRNHHKFVDGEGDETRTRVLTTRNSLSQAVLYPFRSARAQFPLIWRYAVLARRKRPRHFLEIVAQTSTLVLAHLTFAGAAIALHGVGEGIGIYFLALGLPSAFASWSMMFTNFVQHVGCNSQSEHNHSRNFESRTLNWLVFNSGYHTVHHEQPGRHWSEYAKLHAERRGQISAELNWPSIGAYCRRTYFPKASEASASPRAPTPPGQPAPPPAGVNGLREALGTATSGSLVARLSRQATNFGGSSGVFLMGVRVVSRESEWLLASAYGRALERGDRELSERVAQYHAAHLLSGIEHFDRAPRSGSSMRWPRRAGTRRRRSSCGMAISAASEPDSKQVLERARSQTPERARHPTSTWTSTSVPLREEWRWREYPTSVPVNQRGPIADRIAVTKTAPGPTGS